MSQDVVIIGASSTRILFNTTTSSFLSAVFQSPPPPPPHAGALELADCSADLPGLKWMPGVTSWKVLEGFRLWPTKGETCHRKRALGRNSWIGEKALTQLASTADDQGRPVVFRLARGSQQSSHANPPHHVPAERPRETRQHAPGEMVRAHSGQPH